MGKVDIKEVRDMFPEVELLKNEEWKEKVCSIWKEAFENSNWSKLADAQYNPLAPNISLVDHTRAVTHGAISLSDSISSIFGIQVDKDILIVSCLLHDVCKLLEYDPSGDGGAVKSKIGKNYQHGFLSGYYALKEGFPQEVVSILISHTHESRAIPRSLEGLALYYADMADADFHRLLAKAPLLMEKNK